MSKRKFENDSSSHDDKQLQVYEKNGNLEITELDNDSADIDDQSLIIYEKHISSSKRTRSESTWVDEFNFNMRYGNPSVIYCDTPGNNFDDMMMFMKNKLNLDSCMSKVYPTMDSNISVEKAKPPRVVNQFGVQVHGGLMQFYFYDEVTLKLCTGKHGPFLKAFWSKLSLHNQIVSNLIALYNGWENEMIKLQEDILINVPSDKEHKEKSVFVKKFYDIFRNKNAQIYERGIRACKADNIRVVCDMFDTKRFDQVFAFNYEDSVSKPSDSIKMTMYAVLEGFKVGKEKEIETVYNKKISIKPYSVSIQPICFFNIEP
ncbi:dbp-2 [Hemileuca sp. nucleopolyhedrovirus]|uniref:Dbp-2 n=1 Tax=Hemileuca sp. nucleopolyhedrovirus TaxID=1367203 RepID=S5N962_9ABAC|nr:dbp-2 [Hemileuca sp. nucleopolyhedrovirus]AGR56782.1 dbp-2 [Hemileuca sp. nucleopolyhedrovirus]